MANKIVITKITIGVIHWTSRRVMTMIMSPEGQEGRTQTPFWG